jgi:hypothetical protein
LLVRHTTNRAIVFVSLTMFVSRELARTPPPPTQEDIIGVQFCDHVVIAARSRGRGGERRFVKHRCKKE